MKVKWLVTHFRIWNSKKVIKQNNKHALAYLHLYKIAIIEKQEEDIGYYKSRIIKLDDSLINQE